MPEMIPVANQIQPPDPSKGMGLLSGLIGIQQQKQNLQTGAYQQQTAQAEATQAQQRNRELQAAQQLVVNGAKSGQYDDGQGGVNRQKLANDILTVAPTYGQPIMSSLLSQANEIVANKQAHQNLTLSRKNEMGATFASLAADPQLDNTKFIDAIETLRQQHPGDAEFSRMLTSMSTHMPGNADGDQLRALAGRWSAAATGTPQVAPGQIDTGAVVQPGAVNRFTGEFTAGGAPVKKQLAPSQQPNYLGQVVTTTTAAGGQAATDNQVFAKVMASGANAQRGIELAQKVEQEAAAVRTGQYTQEFANRLTVLQQHDPSITARQLLQKDAANLKTLAEEGATTDAERNQIGGGFPSPETMDPDAVQKAARYWQGSFRMAGARRDNAVSHVSQNGTSGLAIKDAAFMSSASPGKFAPPEPKKQMPSGAKLTAYAQAHFGGDTAKASAYLKQQGYE